MCAELSNDMSGLYFKDECLTISLYPRHTEYGMPKRVREWLEFFITNYPSAALGLAAPGHRTRD